jgi:hypothetical protein
MQKFVAMQSEYHNESIVNRQGQYLTIAMYGGRPVKSLKIGTANRHAIPVQNTTTPRAANGDGGGRLDSAKEESSSTWLTRKKREATRHTNEGKKSSVIVGIVESWLLIHNIVVVTSPIGVQTPPA